MLRAETKTLLAKVRCFKVTALEVKYDRTRARLKNQKVHLHDSKESQGE